MWQRLVEQHHSVLYVVAHGKQIRRVPFNQNSFVELRMSIASKMPETLIDVERVQPPVEWGQERILF